MNESDYESFAQKLATVLGETFVVTEIRKDRHFISILGHAVPLAKLRYKNSCCYMEASLFTKVLPYVDGREVKQITNPSLSTAKAYICMLKEENFWT